MTPKMLIPSTLACAVLLAACNRAPQDAATAANNPAVSPTAAPATSPVAPTVDLDQLAERIVTQSAGVKEGEVVMITGLSNDPDLLEALALQVRKQGAFPWLMYGSERLAKRSEGLEKPSTRWFERLRGTIK